MKTRTSQNGIAGLMSWFLRNIKTSTLVLAAFVLAAPSAWGAAYTWKDGASGNTNVGSNWTGGTAPTSGVNTPTFNNSGNALSTINNNITMSNSVRFDDAYVRNGVFKFTGEWWFKTFSMADTDNSEATLTKTGKWVCNNGTGVTYQFRYGVGKNSKASFTNESGDIGTIGTGRTTRDQDFTVGHGEGSDAEFILKAGTVTTSTALVLGCGTSSKGLLVMDGGTMQCNNTNVIARGTGSTGIAKINGGTFNVNKPLFVAKGQDSDGTLIIAGGNYANSSDTFVGYGTNSEGKIAVTNGTLSTKVLSLGCANGANASFVVSNGTVSASDNTHVGYKSGGVTTNYLEVAGGTFSQTATGKHLYIGSEGAAGTKAEVCAKGNGKMNISRSIILGNKVGGTLTVMDNAQVTLGTKTTDGHVNMCYASAYNGDPSYLNLDGGTLTAKYVTYGSGTSGNAFVTFNGGTLKANQATTTFIDNKARLFAKVAAGGGTIDSAGFAITIPAVLASGVGAGETDGGMTFTGGGTITLSGANTYTGATVINAGTTLQMPTANNLAGNIVVTNATLGACPITVLTLTGEGADANDILARCSLAADAPDTVELVADGASIKVLAKASVPAFARLIYDSGTDSWSWEFRDMTDAVIPTVDQSALEAGSVTVRFGSTDELAAIAALGSAPAWVKDYQMVDTFDIVSASATTALPAGFTVAAGTVIDLKGCVWTLPAELKSATVDFTVTNSVDATKAVLTVDVASGATFTETHLTLGGNIELRKTGEGTYTMTKDQPHTGGTVVMAGAMTRAGTVTVGSVAGSSQSLSVEGGSLTTSNSGNLVVGENGVGEFTITNATATMNSLYVGNGTGSGTMDINGGTLTVGGWSFLASSAASGGAVLNLNGGTLETRRINVGTTADSLILFNGGTLFINGATGTADTGFSIGTSDGATPEHLTVAVGENGGTIKTTINENRIKINSGIVKADGVETDGGLRIEGGGKLTVTGSLAYTGGTTVEIGTTLVIPDTSLGGGLSVIFPDSFASAGVYTLVTTTGASEFSAADLPDVSGHPFYRAKLSADGKSIQIERVSPSMTVTAFNQTTGEATIAFEYIDAPLSLVVAWGEKDYGDTLMSWPYNKRAILDDGVAAGTTSATYTLPADALAAGTYYRFFLGDEAATPYDEEVAWIQPAVLGAYITTDNVPSSNPQMDMEINLNNRSYETSFVTLFDAGTGYDGNFWTWATADGKIGGRRGGYATFGPFSKTENLHVKFDWAYPSDSHKPVTVNGTQYTHNNFNQKPTITPTAKLRFWHYAHNGNGIDELNNSVGYSAYQLYYAKLKDNAGKLQAHFIPVKKGNDYGIYDIVANKLYTNKGASGTSFTGGAKVTDYTPVYFANGQLQVSNPRMMGTIELASRDWERPEEHVSLTWTAPGGAATLWVVYSNDPISSAPGEFADPSAWSFCTNIASVAANGTTGTYTLGDPLGDGNRYKTMRFILSKDGDTLVPLLVSEPYRTLKQGTAIYIR